MSASIQRRDVDLLVLGGGAGGMTAALTGSALGLDVLLAEKADVIGGTTSRSAGAVWIPNTRHSKTGDTPERALAYLRASLGNRMRELMVGAFLCAGPQMIDFLEDNTSVRFRAFAHHPDYLATLEGATLAGRVLEPLPFDASCARQATGQAAQAAARVHAARRHDGRPHRHRPSAQCHQVHGFLAARRWVCVGRYGIDRLRFGRGARLVMGNALAARLYYALLQRQVPVLASTEARSLIQESGRIGGAILHTPDGTLEVRARCGVVLATGGITHNARLRQQLMPASLAAETPVVESATGDGAMLAEAAGGHLGDNHANAGFWAPISLGTRRDGSSAVFPHLVLDRGKPGLIAVNPDGRRFVNEATSYHLFAQAMFAELDARPAQSCFLLCDDDFIGRYGLGMVRPRRLNLKKAVADGYLVRAGSIAELAAALGLPPKTLAETVARHNAFAETGIDEDLGKGSDAYQRNLGDAGHAPNPCIGPLLKPPFYAVRIHPGDIGASVGLVTNESAQVVRKRRLDCRRPLCVRQ